MTYPLVTDEAFPGPGVLRCGECNRPMPTGTPYITASDGMVEDTPMSMIVCVYCGPPQADGRDRP